MAEQRGRRRRTVPAWAEEPVAQAAPVPAQTEESIADTLMADWENQVVTDEVDPVTAQQPYVPDSPAYAEPEPEYGSDPAYAYEEEPAPARQPEPARDENVPFNTRRQKNVMDAREVMDRPTVLAERQEAQDPHREKRPTVRGPDKDHKVPIAVIGPDGSMLPFSGDARDRLALLHYNVTYVYHREDLHAVMKYNDRQLREGNVDRVVHGVPMKARPLPSRDQVTTQRESMAVAFSPEMLNNG